MYRVVEDPYCYTGTTVLKNRAGIRSQRQLDRFVLAMTTQRFDEPLPNGRLSISHYLAIHRHLFQDVYSWAGKPRVVRISRGQSMFCYPERIRPEMKRIFAELRSNELLRRLGNEEFSSKAAHVLAEINAVHPFRDGNGRAQLAFLAALAHRAGFDLKLERLRPKQFLAAMIRSFQGREDDLEAQIASLIK